MTENPILNINIITEDTIRLLVDRFYQKVRVDPLLSPIFLSVIGHDEEWQPHMEKMYDFWSSVMLKTRRYEGNPFQKHLMLPPFESELFNRWLALFEETAQEIHEDTIATQYIEKSQQIAKSLKYGLFYAPKKRN